APPPRVVRRSGRRETATLPARREGGPWPGRWRWSRRERESGSSLGSCCLARHPPPEAGGEGGINVALEGGEFGIGGLEGLGRHARILGRVEGPTGLARDLLELPEQGERGFTAVPQIQRQGQPRPG